MYTRAATVKEKNCRQVAHSHSTYVRYDSGFHKAAAIFQKTIPSFQSLVSLTRCEKKVYASKLDP